MVPLTGHQTPSADEVRGCKYCKWHNKLDGHNTVDCRVLRTEILRAIEKGRFVFARAPLKIDTQPFPVNVVRATALPTGIDNLPIGSTGSAFQDRVREAIIAGRVLLRTIDGSYPRFL